MTSGCAANVKSLQLSRAGIAWDAKGVTINADQRVRLSKLSKILAPFPTMSEARTREIGDSFLTDYLRKTGLNNLFDLRSKGCSRPF